MAVFVRQNDRLTTRGKLTFVRSFNVKSHPAVRPCRAAAECFVISNNIHRVGGGDDGAALEREVHCAGKRPSGKIHSKAVCIDQLQIFLGLVSRSRIVIKGTKENRSEEHTSELQS